MTAVFTGVTLAELRLRVSFWQSCVKVCHIGTNNTYNHLLCQSLGHKLETIINNQKKKKNSGIIFAPSDALSLRRPIAQVVVRTLWDGDAAGSNPGRFIPYSGH